MELSELAAELAISPSDFRDLVEEIKDITGIRNHQELFPLLRLLTGASERSFRFWMNGRQPNPPVIRLMQVLVLVLRGQVRQQYKADGRVYDLQ